MVATLSCPWRRVSATQDVHHCVLAVAVGADHVMAREALSAMKAKPVFRAKPLPRFTG
jgi:predicted fused transcriptional regulator/phosphomethylpyrimidine kinase